MTNTEGHVYLIYVSSMLTTCEVPDASFAQVRTVEYDRLRSSCQHAQYSLHATPSHAVYLSFARRLSHTRHAELNFMPA